MCMSKLCTLELNKAASFFGRPTDADAHKHERILTAMNTLTLYPYEHLRRTKLDRQISKLTKSPPATRCRRARRLLLKA